MGKPFLSASKFVVEVNKAQLLKDITLKNQRAAAFAVRREIEPMIKQAQAELIKDFNSHVVTREIEGGPNSSNTSGTLGGYGNLFSFIGFDNGQKPTQHIRSLLSQKIFFKVRTISSGRFKITVMVPSKEEVFAITPLPWASGSSWAEGIEKGISNLGLYLYRPTGVSGSSSGTGIQIKSSKKSVTFSNTSYMSSIFKNFKKSLQNLDK